MSAHVNPDIVEDGLVLCLDAANKKSLLAPPTTNLANNSNDTINWTTSPLGGTSRTQSTVDADSYHYRFVLGSTMNMRFNFDHTNLTNGETYIVSYKYKITSGSGTFHVTDFCDISVNANRVTTDIGDGWYYETAYGTRSSYDETYDFFDFYASAAMTVDIKEMQVEHTSASSPLATPFVSYQRKWEDRAGSNDGTPENMSDQSNFSSEGRGSLIFDGTDDSIDLSSLTGTDLEFLSNPQNNTNLTYSIWSYNESASSYYLFSTGAQTSSTGVALSYQAGSGFVSISTPTKSQSVGLNSHWPSNEWVQFTWVSNGSTYSFYKNGVSILSGNIAGTSSNSDSQPTLRIGGPNNSTCCRFNGKVGGVLVYNKALTAAEVLQNYNATKSRFGL